MWSLLKTAPWNTAAAVKVTIREVDSWCLDSEGWEYSGRAASTMAGTLEGVAKNLLSDPHWMRVFKNTYDSIEDQLNKVEHSLIFGCISFSFFWLLPLLEWQWDLSLVSLLDSLFASSLASRKEMSSWMSPCPYKWQGCRDPMLELWQPMLPKMQHVTIRCSMQPKLQLHFPPGPRKQI